MGYCWGLLGVVLGTMMGCAWARKPYADDPLVRARRASWGDPRQAAILSPSISEPLPPPPPYPENLPTLEWEQHRKDLQFP